MSGAGPLPSIDPFAVLAPPAPPPPMPVAHLAEAPLQPQQRRYTPPPPQQRFEPAETPGHYEDAADMTDAVQQSMDSGGGYVASDYDEGGGSGAKRDKRRHGADRRPLRFWQPFNDWWRSDLERLGRRPNAAEIQAWYDLNAEQLWGSQRPTLQETRVHAKCLRSLGVVRAYFRSYRKKKRGGGYEDEDDLQGDLDGEGTDDGSHMHKAPRMGGGMHGMLEGSHGGADVMAAAGLAQMGLWPPPPVGSMGPEGRIVTQSEHDDMVRNHNAAQMQQLMMQQHMMAAMAQHLPPPGPPFGAGAYVMPPHGLEAGQQEEEELSSDEEGAEPDDNIPAAGMEGGDDEAAMGLAALHAAVMASEPAEAAAAPAEQQQQREGKWEQEQQEEEWEQEHAHERQHRYQQRQPEPRAEADADASAGASMPHTRGTGEGPAPSPPTAPLASSAGAFAAGSAVTPVASSAAAHGGAQGGMVLPLPHEEPPGPQQQRQQQQAAVGQPSTSGTPFVVTPAAPRVAGGTAAGSKAHAASGAPGMRTAGGLPQVGLPQTGLPQIGLPPQLHIPSSSAAALACAVPAGGAPPAATVAAAVAVEEAPLPEVLLFGEEELAVATPEQLMHHIRSLQEELINKRALSLRRGQQVERLQQQLDKKSRKLAASRTRNRGLTQMMQMAWQAPPVALPLDLLPPQDLYAPHLGAHLGAQLPPQHPQPGAGLAAGMRLR